MDAGGVVFIAKATGTAGAYFVLTTLLATLVKMVLRFVPMVLAPAIMPIEINAAMSPYSIAVAPRSSRKNF
jgi:hypothetical protein